VGETGGFDGRTILLAGAGCAAGAILARAFARAGGHVIIIDHDEPAILRIARADPARIDPLRLDLQNLAQVHHFAEIWQDEPLHGLIHLQPLRLQMWPGRAITSVVEVSAALRPALRAGEGRVLIVHETLPDTAQLNLLAFRGAMKGLASLLYETHVQDGIRFNALEVQGKRTPQTQRRFSKMALSLIARGGPPLDGCNLHLSLSGD
jgi:NAD(P)-dependent dehydrogenase (short-subunit alcohol dehydrogenase family)